MILRGEVETFGRSSFIPQNMFIFNCSSLTSESEKLQLCWPWILPWKFIPGFEKPDGLRWCGHSEEKLWDRTKASVILNQRSFTRAHSHETKQEEEKKNQLSSYYIMDIVTFQYKYFKGGGRRFAASADSLLHNEQLAALCSAEPGNMSADWTAAQTRVDQKRELHGCVWKCCRTSPSARQSGWTVKQLQTHHTS